MEIEAPAEPKLQEPSGSPADTAQGYQIEEGAVDTEVKLAREHMKEGDHELARLFLKNASVLNLISNSKQNALRADAIAEMLKACDSKGLLVQAKCSTCGGTGNRVMKVSSLVPGEEQTREVQGSKCPMCKGAGIVRRPGNMDERKFSRARAEERYVTIQQARKYAKVGGAWLPSEAPEKLSVKQNARVRRSTSSPCEECMGFGKTDCKDCESTGVIDCEACEDGNVFIKVNAELTKMTLSRSEKCKQCREKGLLLCAKCGGSGGVLCRKCNGKGLQPECGKCAGEGYTGCRKCNGSGNVEGHDCEYCRGEGVVLCSSCNGDGHR